MFLDLYGYSPYWVKIVWDTLKADSIDNQAEFGEFVTRNFVNRIGEYKRPEIIIACIAGENAIKFDLKEIIPLPYKEYVDRRIGRLLPPYITKVQQNSSQYIVREGLMPVPEELYSDFGASDC